MLQLRLFGSIALEGVDPEAAAALLSQPKRVALVAYLVLAAPGGIHRRDTLLALFWPDADDARARHALNQALYQLRRCLGHDMLLSRGDAEVGLDLGRIECDAVTLLAPPPDSHPEAVLGLYGGDLLPGFHADASPEFDQWLSDKREAARRQALSLALRLAADAEARDDHEGARQLLRRASSFAPLDERVVQRLMQLHDRSGNRGEAMQVYENFAARLMKELEVTPSPETEALLTRIRDRREADVTSPLPVRAQPSVDGPGLVDDRAHSATAHPAAVVRALHPASRRVSPRFRTLTMATAALLLFISIPFALAARDDGHRRILLAPMVNRTGEPSLDALGTLTSDWITEGLTSRSSHLFVDPLTGVAAASVMTPTTVAGSTEWARLMATETRADIVVDGSYHLVGDSLVFHARIKDAAGKVLRSLPAVTTHRSRPDGAAGQLYSRIGGALAGLLDETLAAYEGDMSPPSYEAYQAYVDGTLISLRSGPGRLSVERFTHAYRSDTTFTRALLRLAIEESSRGDRTRVQRWPAFDTLVTQLQRVRGSLSLADRHHLDAEIALRHDRFQEAYHAARMRAEAAPGSDAAARDLAIAASRANRPREAVDRLRALGERRGLLRLWTGYNVFLTDNLHRIGDHEAEWDATHADSLTTMLDFHFGRRLRAAAALGQVDTLREIVQRLRLLPAPPQGYGGPFTSYWAIPSQPAALLLAAQELRSHGHVAAAEPFLDEALRWYAAQPDSATWALGFRLGWARALVMAGRWADAERVVPPATDNLKEWGLSKVVSPTEYYRAIAQARQGRPELARTALRRIASEPAHLGTPYLMCVLHAAMGDEDAAYGYLTEQFRRGFLNWRPIHEDPVLLPLLRKPRFRELVRPRG